MAMPRPGRSPRDYSTGSVGPTSSRFGRQTSGQLVPAEGLLGRILRRAAAPEGGRPGFDLAVPEDQHVRDLLLVGEPDLVLHAAVGVVDLDPQALAPEHRGQLAARL